MRTIGIASGKGGVGKTTISTNVALALARANYRVLLVDGDFGLTNIQLSFGLNAPLNIGHVLSGERSIEEVVSKTKEGLAIIPAASGVGALAHLSAFQMKLLVDSVSELNESYDFVIVDAAAGISHNVITLLTACQETFIVARDEPSSIADGYGIMKVLKKDHGYDAITLIPAAIETPNQGTQLHAKLNAACQKFLGLDLQIAPGIAKDEAITISAKKYQPVIDAFPTSTVSQNLKTLAKTIAGESRRLHKHQGPQFFPEKIKF